MSERNVSKRWRRLRGEREDSETTRQYTAQEIQSLAAEHRNGAGIIRPNTGNLPSHSHFEDLGDKEQTNRPPRIVLAIVMLALAFIAIITYFVMQMPPKN